MAVVISVRHIKLSRSVNINVIYTTCKPFLKLPLPLLCYVPGLCQHGVIGGGSFVGERNLSMLTLS
jgi:hypothetical protein